MKGIKPSVDNWKSLKLKGRKSSNLSQSMLPSPFIYSNLNLGFQGEIRTAGLYSSLKEGDEGVHEGLYFISGYCQNKELLMQQRATRKLIKKQPTVAKFIFRTQKSPNITLQSKEKEFFLTF